jgi:hypothetical protein
MIHENWKYAYQIALFFFLCKFLIKAKLIIVKNSLKAYQKRFKRQNFFHVKKRSNPDQVPICGRQL